MVWFSIILSLHFHLKIYYYFTKQFIDNISNVFYTLITMKVRVKKYSEQYLKKYTLVLTLNVNIQYKTYLKY